MDIFKLIHKIKKLTIDDKISLSKKAALIFIITIMSISIVILIFKMIFKPNDSTSNINDMSEAVYDIDEAPSEDVAIDKIDDNTLKLEEPNKSQKQSFKKYNCLEFSDLTQENGVVSLTIKNISSFEMKNVSVSLYNSDNKLITTINLPPKTKIKPNEKVYLDGFTNEKVTGILYSYHDGKDFITVNLIDKTALLQSNSSPSNL